MSVSHRWPFRNESSNADLSDPMKDRDGQTREESRGGRSLRDSSDSSQVDRQRIAPSLKIFIGFRLCATQFFRSLFCDPVYFSITLGRIGGVNSGAYRID
jgi:hypothetical protein